jgi:FkbH-like protein
VIDRRDVISAYKLVLRRIPESESVIQQGMKIDNLQTLISVLCNSQEYKVNSADLLSEKARKFSLKERHTGFLYATPTDLARTQTPARRVAFIGSCFAESWVDVIRQSTPGVEIEFYLLNNVGELPDLDPGSVGAYDFHVVQIPLRSVIPENAYMKLSYADTAAYERLFENAKMRLSNLLAAAMAWNRAHKITTFVGNYMVPQRAAMGRLLPRYDLRNPSYMIAELNAFLTREIATYENSHLFDIEELSAVCGKRYIQDDSVWLTVHGGMLNDWDHAYDQDRLQSIGRVSDSYESHVSDFVLQLWAELEASWRTLRSADRVKLVIFDLDDTLWRGVAAESGASVIEGWPLGLLEALSYLKKRGVLLAIVSKNDEQRVVEIWDAIFGGRLKLSDFVVRKINWDDKVSNIKQIIMSVNVLPSSVVFVDDNPVEIAAVSAEIPEIRVLGSNPLYMRRVLLWAPETQVPYITDESSRRTEMVAVQADREDLRLKMPRTVFLKTLDLAIKITPITSSQDVGFQRTFELLNKTNQFNTTGVRWSAEACANFFSPNNLFYSLAAKDVYNDYGVVGVCATEGSHIRQYVMSCRVFGLDVELAMIGEVTRRLLDRYNQEVTAAIVETKSNTMCRDLYKNCGFHFQNNCWITTSAAALPKPDYIRLDVSALDM